MRVNKCLFNKVVVAYDIFKKLLYIFKINKRSYLLQCQIKAKTPRVCIHHSCSGAGLPQNKILNTCTVIPCLFCHQRLDATTKVIFSEIIKIVNLKPILKIKWLFIEKKLIKITRQLDLFTYNLRLSRCVHQHLRLKVSSYGNFYPEPFQFFSRNELCQRDHYCKIGIELSHELHQTLN